MTDLKALFADSLLKVKREQDRIDLSINMHMQIGGSQHHHQSDADSLSSASSLIAERAAMIASTATSTAGTWNATTSSKAMQDLVLRRKEVFAAQRKARDDCPTQDLSRERVETAFAQCAGSNKPYHSGYRHYVKFCSRMDVPPFPITYAMMALWLYEKCSARDGYFQTYKHGVGLAADIVESLWTIHPVFRTMRQFDRDGTALSEFLEERRLAVKSTAERSSPKSKASAASKAASEKRQAPAERQDLVASFDSDGGASGDEDSEYGGEAKDSDGGDGVTSEEGVDVAQPMEDRGLPTRDSVYDSLVHMYKVYAAALVPIYGISVMVLNSTHKSVPIRCNRHHPRYVNLPGGACPWVALCRRRQDDSKWLVDFDVSTFEHTHGPCKEILANPTWRPIVHNADARAVLGMPPLAKRSTHKKQTFSEPDQPPRKKARLSATPSSASTMPPPPVPTRPPTSIPARPRPPPLPTTLRWSPSAQVSYPSPVSPSTPQDFSARSAGALAFNKPVSATAPSNTSAARIPPPLGTRISTNPLPSISPNASQPPTSAATGTVAVGSPSTHDDPEKLVSAFCAGLHRSLTTLAEPLVAAGVTSLEGLVALRVSGQYQFDRFLDQLRKNYSERRAISPSMPPLSNVHVLLFAKHMKA